MSYSHRLNMEHLLSSLTRSLCLNIPNDSHFSLEYDEDTRKVIAKEFIPAGACLGQIYGDTIYVWDITHGDYMFIDEDIVLDVSQNNPRTMLTLIRDDNLSDTFKNCVIQIQQDDHACNTRFFVVTTRDIEVGEEIVNAVPSYR